MQSDDAGAAVEAALSLDWDRAVRLNETILKGCPDDVDCLNRLGRAYLELGNCKKATAIFRKVLRLSKYDPIATKNLTRSLAAPRKKSKSNQALTTPVSFLEEPGKTKLIALVNVAAPKVLLTQDYANGVKLVPRRHSILVSDADDNYLGALPDDLGHRLLVLTRGGNKYEGFVKSVAKNAMTIFVREVSRAKKFRNTPSFMSSGGDYQSYLREDITPPANREDSDSDEGHKDLHGDEETEETT